MVPIYIKTVYSFLSSIITIDDLISFAKKNSFSSLCICDDNMYGAMEFIKKCNTHNIKPIIGLDLGNILLYAKDYLGYQNLMKLSTIKTERDIEDKDLLKYHDSLVCFINHKSENITKYQEIYNDLYLYTAEKDNENTLVLHKTLCLNKDDVKVLKYLGMLRDGKKVNDEYSFNENVYYVDIEDKRYHEFINKCNLFLPKYELNLPSFCKYNDTKGLSSDEYLYNLSIAGLNKRLNGKITIDYKERLLYELDIIKKMGFSNYFLIVYDYIKYAKSHDILTGPGRGSAAGSLVSFSLGITDVDPIKYDLLFERFLNIERITMPDIDTDFPDINRDEIIKYVEEKYGKKSVCQITTFNTFGSKMALRDMGRVLNIPNYTIDDLCKRISNMTLHEAMKDDTIKSIINSDNKIKELYKMSLRIEGLPRNSSIHAAGVILANSPLDDVIPLVMEDNKYLSAYEASYLEELGLLKMDFLGLRNLSIISNTLKLIEKYKKIKLRFNDIPLSDDLTYKIFQEGDTLGIFQFEKKGMRDFLVNLHPETFEDIYNANAFYRPGPSSNIDLFIRRRKKMEKITYYHPKLENILKSTCGIIVYQEQIMQIAVTLAGFSLGEADILRRAMSKKKKEEIEKFKDKFINNAIKNGYDKDLVLHLFDLILNFASYGFNKSHSVAYSMISFRMAYLKAHYPLYFYLSILDGSLSDEEKIISYIKEMRKKNIKVLRPDVNKSDNYFTVYYDSIVLPFGVIKGIGFDISKKIILSREEEFTDVYDFFVKMVKESIPKNVIELLIKAGALDSFKYNRNTLYQNIDSLINYGNLVKDLGSEFVLKPEIKQYEEFKRDDLIKNEKLIFGFYLSNHPVSLYKNKFNSINLVDIKKYYNKNITCVVMIDKIKEIQTKKGEKMVFLLASDEDSNCDITIFPKLYEKYSKLAKNDIIKVEGKVERRKDFCIVARDIVNVKEIS